MEEKNTELEYKFAADNIDKRDFREVLMGCNPTKFESRPTHDDVFWQRGDSVIRHRLKGDDELTIKERKSDTSIIDRIEINLQLKKGSDAWAFLTAMGYKQLFTINKSYVDVFEFNRNNSLIEVALYTVARLDEMYASFGERTFIEVEVKPSRDMNKNVAMCVLQDWANFLTAELHLGPPLNFSLFEHYSKLTAPVFLP